MNYNDIHVICPRCGCEMEIANGTVDASNEPSPGIHVLKAKQSGLDFSKFAAMTKPQDRTYDDAQSLFGNDKPVVKIYEPFFNESIRQSIKQDGYVKNTKGHRRFITAQMFRMLNAKGGYTAALNAMPYQYQWDMLLGGQYDGASELKTIAHLEKADREAFEERTMFFNKDVIYAMLDHYKKTVQRFYKGATENEIGVRIDKVKGAIEVAPDYYTVYQTLLYWYKRYYMVVPNKSQKCPEWVDAYKGSGAYYTLMNLVKYHYCFVPADYTNPPTYIREQYAVKFLKDVAHRSKGWELLGLLKEVIKINDFKPNWN